MKPVEVNETTYLLGGKVEEHESLPTEVGNVVCHL